MHTLVSSIVAFIVEKYYMALTEIQLKYVGFMAPLAKKVPDPGLSFEAVFCFNCKRFVFGRSSFKSCCKVRFDRFCCFNSYRCFSSEGQSS